MCWNTWSWICVLKQCPLRVSGQSRQANPGAQFTTPVSHYCCPLSRRFSRTLWGVHNIHVMTQRKKSFHRSLKLSAFRHFFSYVVHLVISRDFTYLSLSGFDYSLPAKKAEKSNFEQVQWAALGEKILLPKQQLGLHASKLLFFPFHMSCTEDAIHYSGELAAKTQRKSGFQKESSLRNCSSYSLAAFPFQTNPEISVQSLIPNCTSRAEYLWADKNPPKPWTSYGTTSLLTGFWILLVLMTAETFALF